MEMTPRVLAVVAVIQSALDTVEKLPADEQAAIFATLAADIGSRPHDGRRDRGDDVAAVAAQLAAGARRARSRRGRP